MWGIGGLRVCSKCTLFGWIGGTRKVVGTFVSYSMGRARGKRKVSLGVVVRGTVRRRMLGSLCFENSALADEVVLVGILADYKIYGNLESDSAATGAILITCMHDVGRTCSFIAHSSRLSIGISHSVKLCKSVREAIARGAAYFNCRRNT